MNLIILTSIIIILGILLWTFLGGAQPVPASAGDKNSTADNMPKTRKSDTDRTTDEILNQRKHNSIKKRRSDEDGGLSRRKSDFIKPDEDFKLPFKTDDIIPPDSPFDIYRKTVENAQNYINKGDYETARTLYEGLNNRISDKGITEKISDNIEYLENFKQVAAKKRETKIKRESEAKSNEIKLSLSGHDSIPEHIQIGITPQFDSPESYMDQIVDKVTRKIDEKQLFIPGLSETGRRFQEYQQTLDNLKNEVSSLNSLKKQLETERTGQLENERDELQKLKSKLIDSIPENNDEMIKELKNELSRLKDQKSADVEKMILQNEINRLSHENTELQKKNISRTEVFNKSEDELKIQISNLQSGLSGLLNQQSIGKNTPEASAGDGINDLNSSISGLSEQLKNISTSSSGLPDVRNLSGTNQTANEETNIKNTMRKEIEDTEEDFESLEHYLKGPKFNEPTDEDILGKILNDAAREHHEKLSDKNDYNDSMEKEKEEFEIKGRKKNEPGLDNFDINRLFEKTDPREEFDNQFYSKFMERQKPSGKKELPILKVTYNFEKLPDSSTLSREQNVLESSFYRYKPMIEKANQLLKRRKVKDALNYYEVVLNQDIPDQFKEMIRKNIQDLNDYLEKYMMN